MSSNSSWYSWYSCCTTFTIGGAVAAKPASSGGTGGSKRSGSAGGGCNRSGGCSGGEGHEHIGKEELLGSKELHLSMYSKECEYEK